MKPYFLSQHIRDLIIGLSVAEIEKYLLTHEDKYIIEVQPIIEKNLTNYIGNKIESMTKRQMTGMANDVIRALSETNLRNKISFKLGNTTEYNELKLTRVKIKS